MVKLMKNVSQKAGFAPGSIIHVGEQKVEEVKISIIDYDVDKFEEKTIENVEECFPFKDTPSITWINISGIHQTEIIEKIGKHFELHPLLMEDILNTGHRPKMEDFGEYIFVVLKMLYQENEDGEITSEQVSLFFGENYVISFQESEKDIFDLLRDRLQHGKGRIRKMGADYLAYAIIDAIVDNYFKILEDIGEQLENTEEILLDRPNPEVLQTIHSMKNDMLFLRKAIWPFREVISSLERGESYLIKETTIIYLHDVYEHTIQVIDTIEMFRDIISGMLDTYLSSISNKMNEVMKVLTIFASIFIPLTFMAGVYGMNFEFMPELHWRWSYPILWIAMLSVGISLLVFFKRKKWL
ncbi:MAG: magnesium/cobalt transporter CorA [Deltaproteobacteria bacterium]|nr:magnesium/cobalt transporter CorA [Deltaproteobacteria bacterium]